MRTHVYLESMAPDGTPGAVKEIQVSEEAPQYLEPLAANDDLGKLRANVHEARAKLQHAKARGKGVAEAQKNFETAKSALDKLHYDQKQERQRQRTGGDHPFAPQSQDTRQFMEPVSYADNDYDDNDEADDADDDALEAKILAAVTAMEKAQSDGKPQSEVLRLAEVVRVLREQRQTPLRETDPPRKAHIDQNPGGQKDTGAIEAPFPGAKKLPDSGTRVKWGKFLAAFDARQAKKRKALQAAHAKNICCEGAYKCSKCQAKAAAT